MITPPWDFPALHSELRTRKNTRSGVQTAILMQIVPQMMTMIPILMMNPVPVIYLFARKVLLWGLDKPYIGGFCRFCHEKGEGAGRKLAGGRFGRFGLMIALMAFVGIPIPGTGAWTGTLGASFLDLGIKKTVLSVTLGVMIAAVIMASVSHVGLHVFGL